MVHRPVGGDEAALRRQRRGGRDARHRLGRIGKPEKGKAVAIADVEEEMLAAPAGQVDRLGQRRSEEPTSELQSLLLISYAVLRLKKQKSTETLNSAPEIYRK